MTEGIVVLVTVPSLSAGNEMSTTLVSEGLVACANLVGPIRSIYHWEGRVHSDEEALLILKTVRSRYAELESRIRALHSYDTPEIIALPIEQGLQAYLDWLQITCRPRGGGPSGGG